MVGSLGGELGDGVLGWRGGGVLGWRDRSSLAELLHQAGQTWSQLSPSILVGKHCYARLWLAATISDKSE